MFLTLGYLPSDSQSGREGETETHTQPGAGTEPVTQVQALDQTPTQSLVRAPSRSAGTLLGFGFTGAAVSRVLSFASDAVLALHFPVSLGGAAPGVLTESGLACVQQDGPLLPQDGMWEKPRPFSREIAVPSPPASVSPSPRTSCLEDINTHSRALCESLTLGRGPGASGSRARLPTRGRGRGRRRGTFDCTPTLLPTC